MIILPAIDLHKGKVVRLEQGNREAETIYSDDPVAIAKSFADQGAQEIHIVDLDGAFTGKPINLPIVKKIAEVTPLKIELGGGLRTAEDVEAALKCGINRVVLGTKACESLIFVREMVNKFGATKIAVGIDAKNGKVATQGWTNVGDWDAVTLSQAVDVAGAATIIYTDIATDGMFTGPNIPMLKELMESLGCQLIASGGIANAQHIESLRALGTLYGAIVGKALYDKKITLAEIL